MKTTIAVIIATATLAGAAHAQSTSFQGIKGELQTGAAPPASFSEGPSFQIDPKRNRELEKTTGVIPANSRTFYRPSILSGQRSRKTQGTGLTLFDKIFGID